MVIPQPMSQKNPDFEPLSPSYVRFVRVLAVGLMPSNLPGGVWGLSRFWAIWGEKSPEKKSFQMCLGILWGGIYDVSGKF